MNKRFILCLLGIVLVIGLGFGIFKLFQKEEKTIEPGEPVITNDGDFNSNFIKKVHQKSNYLISPYSMEIALNMLKDGANGETKEEIEKVVGNRDIKNLSVKDKVGVANAAFVKNSYKNIVQDYYYKKLKEKYNADILYDEFSEPTVINNWVEEKTNGMIKKVLDEMNPYFAIGLANAVALDVKWLSPFECIATTSEPFTKYDGSKMDTEMMHNTFKQSYYKYFENDDVEGVVIPYEKFENSDVELEFVGMLPKKDVDSFINNLTTEKLQNIDKDARSAGMDYNISLSLPRFSYEYSVENLIDVLKNMGIEKAFDSTGADFSNIFDMTATKENFYVDTAVHKAIIELNENGTKAAAVTFFSVVGNALVREEPEIKEIAFNKPFTYMIRDSKTKEIIFFGSVYEPNKWEKSTCSNEM